MTAPTWDPEQYLLFRAERSRPVSDLLNRVEPVDPRYVVDLGCGPGHLSAELARRWSDALVEGVDSSPEMIDRARRETAGTGVVLTQADLREWHPTRPVDVLVCNAVLQWVPGHLELLPRLVEMLAPGGWVALGLPGNFTSPAHTTLADLRTSRRWRAVLARDGVGTGGQGPGLPWSAEPPAYLRRLLATGAEPDVWESTYLHVLPGPDGVLQWMKGTALRPVLDLLDESDRIELLDEYGRRLAEAYPVLPVGGRPAQILAYRRLFAVARRPPGASTSASPPAVLRR
ncbi:MAG: methyltransferase domain-containing protein [Actinomycetes bacterium]